MDISKLPKLSQTDAPPPPVNPNLTSNATPDTRPLPLEYRHVAVRGIGPDVWFNTCVALILLYFGRAFFLYLLGRITGHPYHTDVFWSDGTPNAGQEVTYPDLIGFQMLSDAGVFAFGLIVLFEAFVKAIFGLGRKIPLNLVRFAILLAGLGTLFNLFIIFKITPTAGLPLISALAVAFGGFIVSDLVHVLRLSRIPTAAVASPEKITPGS